MSEVWCEGWGNGEASGWMGDEEMNSQEKVDILEDAYLVVTLLVGVLCFVVIR